MSQEASASITAPKIDVPDEFAINELRYLGWQLSLPEAPVMDTNTVVLSTSTFVLHKTTWKCGDSDEPVFVKKPTELDDAGMMGFTRELLIYDYLQKFRHQMILQFYGYQVFGTGKDCVPCLFFQAEEGTWMHAWDQRHWPHERTLIAIALEIAYVMDFLHSIHIVHRNIKPQSIFVKKDGHVVLTDFHLSHYVKDEPITVKNAGKQGTASFMAPELFQGESGIVGPACDVYSFGVLLFEMFTQLDFASETYPCNDVDEFLGEIAKNRRPSLDRCKNKIIAKLIEDCWKGTYTARPPFSEIVSRLKALAGPRVSLPLFESPLLDEPMCAFGLCNLRLDWYDKSSTANIQRESESPVGGGWKHTKSRQPAQAAVSVRKEQKRTRMTKDLLTEVRAVTKNMEETLVNRQKQGFQRLVFMAIDDEIDRTNKEIEIRMGQAPEYQFPN